MKKFLSTLAVLAACLFSANAQFDNYTVTVNRDADNNISSVDVEFTDCSRVTIISEEDIDCYDANTYVPAQGAFTTNANKLVFTPSSTMAESEYFITIYASAMQFTSGWVTKQNTDQIDIHLHRRWQWWWWDIV